MATNKRKTATAISYDPKVDAAPTIKAFGEGLVADQIIERAKEYDVPVVEDTALAESLAVLALGDMIPQELYEVVAQILLFVAKIDQKL